MTEVARLMTPIGENDGAALTRFNALRHGILSRYTVLPWEDEEEYAALVASLADEHAPQGPTEEHLVEELAGILWRKRRLRMAEGAVHRRGLAKALDSHRGVAGAAVVHLTSNADSDEVGLAVRRSADDNAAEVADIDEDEAMTRRAISILASQCDNAYEVALAEVREDTREWWEDVLVRDPEDLKYGEEPATPDADCLMQFLEDEVMPWYRNKRSDIANRPLIREQAYGEAVDTFKLEKFGRYEVHLDRKLERMLAMLIKLQDLRQPAATG